MATPRLRKSSLNIIPLKYLRRKPSGHCKIRRIMLGPSKTVLLQNTFLDSYEIFVFQAFMYRYRVSPSIEVDSSRLQIKTILNANWKAVHSGE